MSNFRVTEIIDANTIRVEPRWSFTDLSRQKFNGDEVKISNLNASADNEYVKRILSALLLNRPIDLVNPVIIDPHHADSKPDITCNVIVGRTELTYYFPEYSSNQKKAFA